MKLFSKIALISLVPVAIAAGVFFVDPLQYYRRTTWTFPRFYDQQRFQNPAIARTYKYDTVIAGTSMSENIGLELLKKEYGKIAIRDTYSGSSVFEQRSGLDVALRTGQVETVIWELNFSSFPGEVDAVRDTHAIFPEYLYSTNPLSDFKYLLDPVQISHAWQIITNPLPYNRLVADHELDLLNKWANWEKYGEEYVNESFQESIDKNEFARSEKLIADHNITRTTENLRVNIIEIVEAHPEVDFFFYFPPFSTLEHVGFLRQGIFNEELEWRQYAFERLNKYNNVKIFDFQADTEIVTNFNLYKDKAHHNIDVTNLVVNRVLCGEPTSTEEFAENQKRLDTIVREEDAKWGE